MKDILIEFYLGYFTIDYYSRSIATGHNDYGLKVAVGLLAYSTPEHDGALLAFGNTRKHDFDLFYLRRVILRWLDQ